MSARSTELANCDTPFFTDEKTEIQLAEFHVIRLMAQLSIFQALKNNKYMLNIFNMQGPHVCFSFNGENQENVEALGGDLRSNPVSSLLFFLMKKIKNSKKRIHQRLRKSQLVPDAQGPRRLRLESRHLAAPGCCIPADNLLLCFYKLLKLKHLWYLRCGLFLDTIEISPSQWVRE